MARQVFFSFHYARDIWRVNQVRNSQVIRGENELQKFIDKASFEALKRQGPTVVKRWIAANMVGTSVTVVLIGAETYTRPYVRYEIELSHKQKKGLLGIYINGIPNVLRQTDVRGQNPFFHVTTQERDPVNALLGLQPVMRTKRLSDVYPVYDWVLNNGRQNIGTWIEAAAKKAGR